MKNLLWPSKKRSKSKKESRRSVAGTGTGTGSGTAGETGSSASSAAGSPSLSSNAPSFARHGGSRTSVAKSNGSKRMSTLIGRNFSMEDYHDSGVDNNNNNRLRPGDNSSIRNNSNDGVSIISDDVASIDSRTSHNGVMNTNSNVGIGGESISRRFQMSRESIHSSMRSSTSPPPQLRNSSADDQVDNRDVTMSSASTISSAYTNTTATNNTNSTTININNTITNNTNPSTSDVNSSITLNFENYDDTVLKVGWLNKSLGQITVPISSTTPSNSMHSNGDNLPRNRESRIYETLTNNSSDDISSKATSSSTETQISIPDYRLYRAQLKGPLLMLYKSSLSSTVKNFDPALKTNDTEPSNVISQRQSVSSAKNVTNKNNETGPVNVKLKYLDIKYPHPELQVDKYDTIIGGTPEALCHTIIFSTNSIKLLHKKQSKRDPDHADDELTQQKNIINLLVILPLLDDFIKFIQLFNQFGLTFTKHKSKLHASSTQYCKISETMDNQMSGRLVLLIRTILEFLPGYLLDDSIFQAIITLIDTISLHNDEICNQIKLDVANKCNELTKLTKFTKMERNSKDPSPVILDLLNVDKFLLLDSKNFAEEVHSINLKFNKHWAPSQDFSLLYDSKYCNKKVLALSPLIFNNKENVHFLGRLLVTHVFSLIYNDDGQCKKGAKLLEKWVQLGCIFEQIGDMVSWLAIATVICSIPVLRLGSIWKIMPESTIKVVLNDWIPTIVQLERRQISSKSTGSVFILAPPNLDDPNIKNNVVSYFGDLIIHADDLPSGTKLKYLAKKINRTKNAFQKWQARIDAEINKADFGSHLPEVDPNNSLVYDYWSYHINQQPINIDDIMKRSLKSEPPLVDQRMYSSIGHKRSSLMTGNYLPTLFNSLIPSYSLFPKSVLIGAAGVISGNNFSRQSIQMAKELTISEPIPQGAPIPSKKEHRYSQITGLENIDLPVKKEISGKPHNKHHLLKSIRDAFNVDLDVFHVSEDMVFKSIIPNQGKSRPSSIVVDTPKRFSQYSATNSGSTNAVNRESATMGGRISKAFENLELFDNVGNLSDSMKELHIDVGLKAANLERIFDLLVLSVNAFSKLVDSKDLERYYTHRKKSEGDDTKESEIGLLDFAYVKINMDNNAYTETFFNTYKSFTTTLNVLESLARRFVGAKSCSLSLEKIMGSSDLTSLKDDELQSKLSQMNAKKFPSWDLNVSKSENVNLVYLAKVQIGAVEAIYYLIKNHYRDLTDDLSCHNTVLDIIKIVEEEVTVEWDSRIKKFKEGDEIDAVAQHDIDLLVKKLGELFTNLKSTYRRQLYKPASISKLERSAVVLNEKFMNASYLEYKTILNNKIGTDKLVKDFRELRYDKYEDIVAWVNRLNDNIVNSFTNVTRLEWFTLFQHIDYLSNSSLTSFFKYPLSSKSIEIINSGSSLLNELEISDIFNWISTLMIKTECGDELFINKIPPSIKALIEMHNCLTDFFISQLGDYEMSIGDREAVYTTIIQILNYVHWKTASLNLFEQDNTAESLISPHIPSFIETAISRAIVAPESRYNEVLWKRAYMNLSAADDINSLKSIQNIIDDLNVSHIRAFLEVDNVYTNKPINLCPCPGWFTSRLLEISQYVPNMSITNTKLINFDKRRFVCNIIYNVLELLPSSKRESSREVESTSILSVTFTDSDGSFRKQVKAAALEIAQAERLQESGIFNSVLIDEVDKIRREQNKRDILASQELEAQQSIINQKNTARSKRESLLLVPSTTNSVPSNANVLRNKRSSAASVSSRNSIISSAGHSGMSRKIGGFFRRPFSISGFNSSSSTYSSSANSTEISTRGTIATENLPYIEPTLLQEYKPVFTIKTFEIKSIVDIINHNKVIPYAHAFKIVMQDGNEILIQAVTSNEASEWVKLIKVSKRYSFHSKKYSGQTHNKIFGVPLEDICERENTLIPTIVVKLLEEIEMRGLDEVGLYRVPGSVGSINALKNAFDEEGAINNSFTLEDDRWFEINAIAGCFKMYLRELPDSLFTNSMISEFTNLSLQLKSSNIDFEQYKSNMKRLLALLPPCYYATLKRIMIHLNKVHKHVMNNRMDASNLSIVFAMSFIDQDDLTSSMGPTLGAIQSILQKYITAPEDYFD